MQKRKGISLIVLVVTILVMVILAGTAIITMQNSDIIWQSTKTVSKTNIRQVQELAKIAWVDGNYAANPTVESLTTTVNQALIDAGIDPNDYNITVTLEGVNVTTKGSDSTDLETGDDGSDDSGNTGSGVTDNSTKVVLTVGSGTQSDPYMIIVKEHLVDLATQVNSGSDSSGLYFKLGADLDLSSVSWTPIGNSTYAFEGFFDGDNHNINYLTTTTGGLFGYNSGRIINLNMSNCEIRSSTNNVGVIVGSNIGIINNCSVSNSYIEAENKVGGVAGISNVKVTNCSIDSVIVIGIEFIGGLVGHNCSSVDGSTVSNSQVSGNKYVGGIIGVNSSTVSNCDLVNSSPSQIAGLNQYKVTNCRIDGVLVSE